MVLFKSNDNAVNASSLSFTFHYGPIQINVNLSTLSHANDIYIPLWSYSNKGCRTESRASTKFTFHYGPIQMENVARRQ